MADEATAVVATEPGGTTALPADDQVETQVVEQQPEPITVEGLAAEEGWVPKEQFTGDPEKWRPAHEYLRVGKQAIRAMSRDLRATRDEVSRIARTAADTTARAVEDERKRIEAVHAKAVEDGDHATASKAVTDLVKLQQQPADARSAEPSETLAWKDRNKWFEKDRVATGRAMEIAERSRQLGATVAEQLEDAERGIRKEFPDLFPKPAKSPAATQTGQARNANRSGAAKTFADMPAESQAMAKDYLARHGVPLETTAASYWSDQAKSERKVG